MSVVITAHAARRYVERVNPALTFAEAVEALHRHDNAIRTAARFGCHILRLGDGSRLVVDDGFVITVLSREWRRQPVRQQEFGWRAVA